MAIWKDVKGFEGLYKVSNEGVLVGTPRKGTKGGIVKQYKMNHGYMEYHLYKNNELTRICVHRLLATHFIPNPDNKPCVNHIDGNRANNSLENLEWVTYKENSEHAVRTGLFNHRGENHSGAKLTDQEVREIRDLHKHKIYKQVDIATLYGTSNATVSRIVLNRFRKAAGN